MPSMQSISKEAAQADHAVSNDPMHTAAVPSDANKTATDSPQAQEKKSQHMPHWPSWNERPVATLHEAVCLAHGINPPGYWKLDDDDSRLTRFRPHLKTLRQWVTYYKIRLAPAQDYDDAPDKDTRIVLRDFVECVVAKELFQDLTLPDELLSLNPPLPQEFQEVQKASPSDDEQLQETRAPDGENERLNKAWARLVILMAMKHYKFVPAWPVEELSQPKRVQALYQPLADLSKEMGFALLGDRETVRFAIFKALTRMGKDEVERILSKVEERKTSAQGASEEET